MTTCQTPTPFPFRPSVIQTFESAEAALRGRFELLMGHSDEPGDPQPFLASVRDTADECPQVFGFPTELKMAQFFKLLSVMPSIVRPE